MECVYCHKNYSSVYSLKLHQNTAKYCISIQEQSGVESIRKKYDCSYCKKTFTQNTRLRTHLTICKIKLSDDLKIQKQTEHQLKKIERTVEDTKRHIEDKLDDELYRIQSETKLIKEELENELRLKEEKNRLLEERIKQLEEKAQRPTVINNQNNTYNNNNNLTIHNYMTPERVTEIFDKHYTIETLLGGQKALANFVVDQFVAGKDKMVYLCVDRSRKKCMYTKDFETFHEDVNNELLLRQLTPAMRVIRDKVGWTEYEKKYNPHLSQIHESYDEILAIPDDGTIFRSQLCKRLPASVDNKHLMDDHALDDTFSELRSTEEKEFEERKDEVQRAIAKTKQVEVEVMMVPNQICGIGLGRLDDCRKRFKKDGIYTIHPLLKEQVESDPTVAKEYEDYVKWGTFRGKVIWE